MTESTGEFLADRSESTRLVGWFRSAAPYINLFKNKLFVTSVSKKNFSSGNLARLIQDLSFLRAIGVQIILVFDPKDLLDEELNRRKHSLIFEQGVPIIDDKAAECFQAAIGMMRIELESLFSTKLPNTSMNFSNIKIISGNFVDAKPVGIHKGVNFCKTGDLRKIDVSSIKRALDLDAIVLISPLGFSATGEIFFLNSEKLASDIASIMRANKLIFITDSLNNSRKSFSEIRELLTKTYEKNKLSIIEKFPRLNYLFELANSACNNNVDRTHILPYEQDGEILLELFTRDGVGIMVSKNQIRNIRPAVPADINSILSLIYPFKKDGTLTKRDKVDIERNLSNYIVLDHDGQICGCACLNHYSEENVAEISCLIVRPDYQQKGEGSRLLKHVLEKAKRNNIKQIFALTTKAEHWFLEKGFIRGEKHVLPKGKIQTYEPSRNSLILIKSIDYQN